MGSSFHGLNPLLLQLTHAGYPAILVETSELIYYRRRLFNRGLLDRRGFAVRAQRGDDSSFEGKSRHALRSSRVTNTANSPLARRSNAVVLTRAGEEFSVSCKTYVCALVALKFLGDQLCGTPSIRTRKELNAVVRPVTHYLARWKGHVESMLPQLTGVRQLFLVGRGPSLAAVGTGALILKGIHAISQPKDCPAQLFVMVRSKWWARRRLF